MKRFSSGALAITRRCSHSSSLPYLVAPRRWFADVATAQSTSSAPPADLSISLPRPSIDPMKVPIPNPGSREAKAAFKAASTSTSGSDALTHAHVKAAYKRIQGIVAKSPLDYSPRLSKEVDAQIYLKKEHVSIVGSYKERGALNKLLQLSPDERAHGVICSSAGNHAQAVAYHSTRLGIDGVIVMPINAPQVKVMRVKEFGAKVVQAGESFAEAYEAALKIAQSDGRTFIHAFNDNEVIAGQGTVAMELLEQNPYMDAVVVPVGGGGLIAGMALFLKQINPRIQIYGVETAAMPGMYESVRAGRLISVPKRATMADGIAIENVGALAFDIIQRQVDGIVQVDEDEMAAAVLALLEKEKTVVEASGAAALAAMQSNKLPQLHDKNVVLLLTGSNIDMTLLGRIIDKGLVKSGRLARIHVTVADIPGQLARVLTILHECRANVKDVEHERAFMVGNVGLTQPIITMETRDFEHVAEIVKKLQTSGFPFTRVETPISSGQ